MEIALVTGRWPRHNQTNRIHKNKYCKKSKTTTYYIKACFYLFPKKALKGFKTKHYYEPKDQEALMSINTSNIYPSSSNAEEEDFKINLNLMDTK